MASIYDLKPRFQDLLRPLCRGLVAAGVTANQVTIAAVLLSAVTGAAVWGVQPERWPLLLLPAVLFARMALNAIDGMIAREHGMQTALGAVLNEIGDVVADAALYLPLAARPDLSGPLIVTVVVGGVVVEMTGVVGVQIGASRRYDGPMGKSDRAFVFGAVGLALGLGAPAGRWLDALWWAMLLLLAATVVRRARGALRELDA